MIRYMSIMPDTGKSFNDRIAFNIEQPIYFMDKKPPDTPYIKLDIKIVGKEKRFKSQRAPKARRTCGDIIKSILVGGWR